MAQPARVAGPATSSGHAGALVHLALCAAIAVAIAAVMARPTRDAGEPPFLTLETALPPAVTPVPQLLDVLVEGPIVSSAWIHAHTLDVLIEGPLVTAASGELPQRE